jgi:hypothetical protein
MIGGWYNGIHVKKLKKKYFYYCKLQLGGTKIALFMPARSQFLSDWSEFQDLASLPAQLPVLMQKI